MVNDMTNLDMLVRISLEEEEYIRLSEEDDSMEDTVKPEEEDRKRCCDALYMMADAVEELERLEETKAKAQDSIKEKIVSGAFNKLAMFVSRGIRGRSRPRRNFRTLIILQKPEMKKGKKRGSSSSSFSSSSSPYLNIGPKETPAMVVNHMRNMRGYELRMIMKKRLFFSDIRQDLARLLIPFKQIVQEDFLTEAERSEIDEIYKQKKLRAAKQLPASTKIEDFKVQVLDSDSRQWEMGLARWDMEKKHTVSQNFCLQTKWKQFVVANEIRVDDVLQVWSFRVEGKLCLSVFTS